MINNPKGFTLIETLVAVLLLATAVAGPLTIASRGLLAALVAKDQITAFYLAQDAVEQVRFLRDSACLGAGGSCTAGVWLSSLAPCVSASGSAVCQFDSLAHYPAAPAACTAGVCEFMHYDTTARSFNYNAAAALTPQHFLRSISIKYDAAVSDEAFITVSVSWEDQAGVTRMPIVVRETLFRWQ